MAVTRPLDYREEGKPTFISLFTGIGGFDLGLERAGWECIAQCDNDPFCNKVLAKHWPEVKRYDDVQAIRLHQPEMGRDQCRNAEGAGSELPRQPRGGNADGEPAQPEQFAGPIDLVCGGFPCQDLSVAGKRAGLDGARSGLWFEFHRILSELRPTFALIENVPGLLSSNQGRDFGVVLAGLGELWPAVGWAVLDSQHFGVAQRRRRVYVIAGPSRECVQQILSLCEGGDWNTQARRAEREDVAATIRGRSSGLGVNEPGRGGEDDANLVLANTLPGHHPRNDLDNDTYIPTVGHQVQTKHRSDFESETFVTHTLRADGFDAGEDGTGRGTPLIAQPLRSNRWGGSDSHGDQGNAVMHGVGVRRLTPVECERLQGFPDDWTRLDEKTPDGPRYKACGNAVSVPVIEYIGRRMREVLINSEPLQPAEG